MRVRAHKPPCLFVGDIMNDVERDKIQVLIFKLNIEINSLMEIREKLIKIISK